MTDMDRYHTDYEADTWVVSVWNGAGVALTFETAEGCEEFLEMYEKMRVAHSFPWVHSKPAVRGELVLGMLREGLYPWAVGVLPGGGIGQIKPIPLHRIAMQQVTARYKTGQPRLLEVWAASEYHALIYAEGMLGMQHGGGDLVAEVDFENTEVLVAVEERQHADQVKRATAPVLPEILGFGKVADIKKL